MKINRCFSSPTKWTFTIKPVIELLRRYVGNGIGWADPFAGENSPAEITNDHNPDRPSKYHLDAHVFCKTIKGKFKGVIFDPPYSHRQISEHYKVMGLKVTEKDTSYNFYRRVMDAIIPKIEVGGYAISFGWNSNGFGKSHGFKKIEILLIAHGAGHNDTICVVEKKTRHQEVFEFN